MEAPVLLRLIAAWKARDAASVSRWNDEFIATRETAELRAETLQMGYSLGTLLRVIDAESARTLDTIEEITYPTAFAYAVVREGIDARDALAAYLFAWIENQALAALKAVPLGQTDAQRLLSELGESIAGHVDRAALLGDDELANFAPGLALASSRHETQYSRIFRS
jgi:urease accessory protein